MGKGPCAKHWEPLWYSLLLFKKMITKAQTQVIYLLCLKWVRWIKFQAWNCYSEVPPWLLKCPTAGDVLSGLNNHKPSSKDVRMKMVHLHQEGEGNKKRNVSKAVSTVRNIFYKREGKRNGWRLGRGQVRFCSPAYHRKSLFDQGCPHFWIRLCITCICVGYID